MDQRVTDKFLINLHRMRVKEFDKWLKLVQKKIKVNNRFCQDFVIYLRWLIREVFIIITELWDEPELPRFEQVIRDDLRSFELNLSSLLIRNQGDKTKNCTKLIDLYQVDCIQDGKNKEFHHDGHLEFPKTLDSFKEYEFNKERESIIDSIREINELIEKNDISIRMFNALTGRYLSSSNRVELTAFEAATGMLCNLIRTTSLPRYIKDKKHLQKMILGGFYLRKGDKGFAELANQINVRYGGIIYIIKPVKQFCVFPNILTLIYIGVTWKTLLVRFTEHVEDAVDSYMKDSDWSSRWIERLIQTAMEDFFKLQYPYISGISPLKHFIDSEISGKEEWEKKNIIKKIAETLYHTYFDMEVIEVHRNYETALPRESWYIKNFTHSIKGKFLKGSLCPNGLNMVTSPRTSRHKTLPLYDIIFLISLGWAGPRINDMIQKHYGIDFNYRIIYRILNKFWGNWDNVLDLFFKPVIRMLLEHRDYDWGVIARAIHRNPSYRRKKNFNKWFFGLNVTQIRLVMDRAEFCWNNLKEIAQELKVLLRDENFIKGVSIEKWDEWFLSDIGMGTIAKELGYKNVQSFRSAWVKQGRVSIFQLKFGKSYILTVKKYRKKKVIELLTDEDFVKTLLGSKLYWIYVKVFGFMEYQDYAVATPSQGFRNCYNFFDKLFEDDGLTAKELENLTPFDCMDDLRIYKIINKILDS